jgi:hypothetical protein
LVKLNEEKQVMKSEMEKERMDIEEQISQAYQEWEKMQNPKNKRKKK